MRPQKILIAIVVFSFTFLTASECDDQCSKCQDAINHMLEKIESQFCNPNTMQKAWDAIREECDHSDSAVGLMAETCSITNANTARPGCNVPSISMAPYNIAIGLYVQNQAEQNFNIIVNVRDHSSVFEIGAKTSGWVYFSPDGFSITEGDPVDIIAEIIPATGPLQEIDRATETFSFARKGYWDIQRSVDILLFQNSATFQFYDW